MAPTHSWAQNSFPAWQDATSFLTDLRGAALISNLPNTTSEDYYIGLSTASAGFRAVSGNQQFIPSARVSIYPSPGYNLWAQFSKWPGEDPAFSVGTGVQVEFQAENIHIRQAIGLTWNELHGDQFIQRDISPHALYGWAGQSFQYGCMAIINMQHVLTESGSGISNYDESFVQVVPYINWMFTDRIKVSIRAPLDKESMAWDMSCEWFWGKRD